MSRLWFDEDDARPTGLGWKFDLFLLGLVVAILAVTAWVQLGWPTP